MKLVSVSIRNNLLKSDKFDKAWNPKVTVWNPDKGSKYCDMGFFYIAFQSGLFLLLKAACDQIWILQYYNSQPRNNSPIRRCIVPLALLQLKKNSQKQWWDIQPTIWRTSLEDLHPEDSQYRIVIM